METYQYEPLGPGQSIRYMVLKPGGEDDPLVCSLHESDVNSATFEAISMLCDRFGGQMLPELCGQTPYVSTRATLRREIIKSPSWVRSTAKPRRSCCALDLTMKTMPKTQAPLGMTSVP
ncbi:hypothetical protein CGMCC3_g11703 [Colletotrichum fructicola]|nr:uncharacterized protein CGMCC3_g11703 [Colletotrichum fructicola]KAE9572272.1 hypothetical protein CGMCC3_g11703 [Colletotrichum fructicola]